MLIIQPFNATFFITDCRLLCLLSCILVIRVEQSFTAGMFPSLVLLIANHGNSCIDLFWPSECMYNYEYLVIYLYGIVASFAVGMYNVMFAWKWVQHFQQRVSCIINHDLIVYSVQKFIMVTICAVLLLLIALLHPAVLSRSHNMEPISVQLKPRTLL